MKTYQSIDEYIQQFPETTQKTLAQLRKKIKQRVPEITETISYGIPTLKLYGKNLVHFAGYKTHIGFYPGASGIAAFQKQLAVYKTSKGTVQFPLDTPLPFDLIKEMVAMRVQEEVLNQEKAKHS